MFKQIIRKISTQSKPIYSTKEYVDLYINSNKSIWSSHNILFGSIGALTGFVGMSIIYDNHFDKIDKHFYNIDKHFDKIDKHFDKIDKHFDTIEADLKDIKKILIEEFSKKK